MTLLVSLKRIHTKYIVLLSIIALIMTITRLIIIHYYVNWKFLWGGDQIPILNPDNFIASTFQLELPWRDLGILFIPQLSLNVLSYMFAKVISMIANINGLNSISTWIVNSIMFFIGLFAIWYALTPFKYLNNSHRYVTFVLASLFFTFNPWATVDTFKSYLGATSIQSAFMLALIAFYFRSLRYFESRQRNILSEALFIVAITLILCSISPASAVRITAFILILEAVTVVFIFFLYIWHSKNVINEVSKWRTVFTKGLARTMVFLSVPLISSIFALFFFLATGYFNPLKHRVITYWGSTSPPRRILYPHYATMTNSFIGMTSWIAHSNYMPYHELYEKGLVAALMLLWPLISLGGAMLFLVIRKKVESKLEVDRLFKTQLLLLLSLSIFFLAWGTALNPPFGSIKSLIVGFAPIVVKVIPWGYALTYLKYVYIIFTSYVLSTLFILSIAKKTVFIHKNLALSKIILPTLFCIFIAFLLLTALPIFNGQAFGQYFNPSIKGFTIPKDYEKLTQMNLPFYEHILLLPQTTTYASTSWGWQGSVAWYHRLNNALLVYALVPYSEYTNWSSVYQGITKTCIVLEDKSFTLTDYVDVHRINILNGKLIKKELLPNGTVYILLTMYGDKYADIVLPLSSPLNISTYRWLEIDLHITGRNRNNVNNAKISPWVFIYSGKFGGAHVLVTKTIPASFRKVYAVGVPDKPWSTSKYDPKHVTGFILQIRTPLSKNLVLSLLLRISAGNEVTLCKGYLKLLDLLNVKYIVIDKSLNTYSNFYKSLESVFESNCRLIYNGTTLSIYKTTINSSPIKMVEPANGAMVKLENVKPYYIKAKIVLKEPRNKILLVIPMLYSSSLPVPIKVIASSEGKPLRTELTGYHGLMGVLIEGKDLKNINVVITYTTPFLCLYLGWIIIDLLPLVLLFTILISVFQCWMTKVH